MRTWFVIPVAALAAGCVVQTEEVVVGSGLVEVTWQVGASGCELSGVTDVVVEVGPASETFACSDGGGSLEVPEGEWRVDAFGIDEDGVERYAATDERVRVFAGETATVPTLVLGALPAALTVTWFFENGRLCGGNGVEEVDITLFDDDYIADSLTTACDDGIETLEAVTAGAYTISVLGRDAQGTARFGGDADVELFKGAGHTVEVMVSGL
jgi:hypothetical protein